MDKTYLDHEKAILKKEDSLRRDRGEGEKVKEEALQIMGKAAALNYMSQYTALGGLAFLKKVKDAKTYRELGDRTWAGFCTSCGLKHKTVDEQLQQVNRLGLEFLEMAKKIGLTRRDLRQVEVLPADTRAEVVDQITNMENPTKEQIGELIDRIEDQAVDIALLEDKNAKQEEKLAKREAVIVKGGLQCKEMEDKMRAMQKEMHLVLIKDDEKKSIERLAEAKKKFEVALVHIFTVDLEKATPAVRGAVVSLYEYMRVLIKQYFVEIAAKYPELGAEMKWEPPGEHFKNMWGPDCDDEDTPGEEEGAADNKQ